MGKRTLKSVKKSAALLWGKVITSKGLCEHCGRSPDFSSEINKLEPHHVYGRGISTRLLLDLRNGCCLCHPCHRWAEGNPIEFTDWFRSVRPEDADYLAREHKKGPLIGPDKRTMQDYIEIESEFKDIIRSL